MWKTVRGSLLLWTAVAVTAPAGVRPNTSTDGDWNQWRGPHRTGVVASVTPQDWPEQFELVWTKKVGEGMSGPVVAGDTLFLHARRGVFGKSLPPTNWEPASDSGAITTTHPTIRSTKRPLTVGDRSRLRR